MQCASNLFVEENNFLQSKKETACAELRNALIDGWHHCKMHEQMWCTVKPASLIQAHNKLGLLLIAAAVELVIVAMCFCSSDTVWGEEKRQCLQQQLCLGEGKR